MGVWIEMHKFPHVALFTYVTPFVGVWIEIRPFRFGCLTRFVVTPFVGVWIEIFSRAV